MEAYQKLEALNKRLYNLRHLLSLGMWDARTMMPPKGNEARGDALGTLMELMHDMFTSAETKALLEEAKTVKDSLSPAQQANLREMERAMISASALPGEFVARKTSLSSAAQTVWAKCRANNDFLGFLPTFEKTIAMVREEARLRSAATGEGLYESMFHQYEPGMSLETLESTFADLKSWLPKLLRDIQEHRKDIDVTAIPAQGPYPREKQEALLHKVMEVMKFDFDAGRLDVSAHPFSGGAKEDTRITTNFDESDYCKALFAVIHETGHSKYETHMGPRDMRGQPVCEYRSMGLHESQSRFQEVIIGRSGAYTDFILPLLKEYLGDQPAFTEENLRKLHQHVEPGFVRIRADEVCYSLHILLRYEIERAIVEGKMEAAEIPAAWNAKMKEYLGLDTEGRDDIGCLQDVHWGKGAFGYFPTYALGSMFAAQLMATIKKELGEDTVEKCIRNGDLAPIFAKQEEKIWSQGCLYETEDLMAKATGEKLNLKYFREHLERRYLRNED